MKIRSVERVLDVLETLSREKSGLTLAQLSDQLKLHRSTVYRLLCDLRERGYVGKVGQSDRFTIGFRFVEMAGTYLENLELKSIARPYLLALSKQSGHTAFLACLNETEVVYIDKAEQPGSLRFYSIVGTHVPLHCTALGKAVLMCMSNSALGGVLKSIRLTPHTKNTLSTVDSLKADLARSRERGWTVDDCERHDDVRCVGAPILDIRRRPVAAISISDYAGKMTPDRVPLLGSLVNETAGEISRLMGFGGSSIPGYSREPDSG